MENRRLPRNLFFARVEVTWPGGCESGMIEDRSANGMAIRLRKAIEVGTEIKLTKIDKGYLATVRHCKRSEGQYLIGLELGGPA